MKNKRTKRKLQNQKVYVTSGKMIIHDPLGNVIVERYKDRPGEISFMCSSTIDGERLEKIKEEFEDEINDFRTGGYQGDTV